MEICIEKRQCTGRRRLEAILQIDGDCMTCMEMCQNGAWMLWMLRTFMALRIIHRKFSLNMANIPSGIHA